MSKSRQDLSTAQTPNNKVRIALLGGGERAAALLSLFWDLEETVIVGLAEKDSTAPGVALADEHRIATIQHCRDLKSLNADIIVDVAENPEMRHSLSECKLSDTEIIGPRSAALISGLLEDSKRSRENEELLTQLSEAYDQIAEREQELTKNRADMQQTNRKLEKHLAEMFFIHEFFKALTSFSPSVADVAGLIADGANGILGVELSCVYLVEDETRLRLVGFQGRTREQFTETVAFGEGLVGRCAQDRKLVNKDDTSDNRALDSFMANDEILKTEAAVPLVVHDRLLGVLVVGQTMDRRFTERELARTESIGHMSSLAMQNAIFNSELERLSVTDRLTELYNHGYFQQRLEEELRAAKPKDAPVSLLLLDIDYFKQFNDTFGHPKGDKVLKRVASILTGTVQPRDIVARYGGEEFVVIVPGGDKTEAAALGERIRAAVEAEKFEGDENQPVVTKTVSIGVASAPQDTRAQAKLVEKADQALYKAKNSGRNRVISF